MSKGLSKVGAIDVVAIDRTNQPREVVVAVFLVSIQEPTNI